MRPRLHSENSDPRHVLESHTNEPVYIATCRSLTSYSTNKLNSTGRWEAINTRLVQTNTITSHDLHESCARVSSTNFFKVTFLTHPQVHQDPPSYECSFTQITAHLQVTQACDKSAPYAPAPFPTRYRQTQRPFLPKSVISVSDPLIQRVRDGNGDSPFPWSLDRRTLQET